MFFLYSPLVRHRATSFLILIILLTSSVDRSLAKAQAPSDSASSPVAQSPFTEQTEEPQLAEAPFAGATDRVTAYVDDNQRATLAGNRHPLAIAKYDAGSVAPDFRMDRMIITLLPDPAQQNALDELLEAQHDPESPSYHRWLSPEEYGQLFGASASDAAQVADWLQAHGMEVEEVTAGHRSIIFSGTAAQVESAFHTEIHTYKIGKETHHANSSDPQIPVALAQVVGGVVSLHDFYSKPMHTGARLPTPSFTTGGSYYIAPADFATIYDLGPLYQQSLNGAGQSVAIVARSNINLSDVRQFRASFDLPANDPHIIVNGMDPGIVSSNEETEADLDVEWSGAVARNAGIEFVVSKSTNSSDGSYLSAQYIVNHNVAPVMSMSFSLCEAALGSSGNNFINGLWQQAAAQGISVFVSAGDSGAAGCDSPSSSRATQGRAVNGLCSSPFSVCVGGSEFSDANGSLYWSASNAPGTQSSALSYIPEEAWNESGSELWAGGGGASTIYSKPFWQTGAGVPADGKRDVPDVSLTSAGHNGYLIYQDGGLYVVGGTSAASPSFAGVMALVVQSAAVRQGNPNPTFYSLGTRERAGGASVFHDITSSNNSVPGVAGFNAVPAYDQATGLGSINASVLVAHWSDATATPAFHASSSVNALSVTPGASGSTAITVAVSGGFDATVTLAVTGLPSGVSASFLPVTLTAPGSGSSLLKVSAVSNAKLGAYSISVSATSGGLKQQIPISLTIGSKHTTPFHH